MENLEKRIEAIEERLQKLEGQPKYTYWMRIGELEEELGFATLEELKEYAKEKHAPVLTNSSVFFDGITLAELAEKLPNDLLYHGKKPEPDSTLAQLVEKIPEEFREQTQVFAKFTDRARKVMWLAREEAQRFNHEHISTEHLLLGLVKEGSGVAAHTLKNMDIDLRKVRAEVERIVQAGPDLVNIISRNFWEACTPILKNALRCAQEEAKKLGHNYVGTEHLLLGILRESSCAAAQVLVNIGSKLEDVREAVLDLLGVKIHGSKECVCSIQDLMARGCTCGASPTEFSGGRL